MNVRNGNAPNWHHTDRPALPRANVRGQGGSYGQSYDMSGRKNRSGRWKTITAAVALIAIGIATVAHYWPEPREVVPDIPEPRGPKISYEGFNAGNIITDEEMFDYNSMNIEEIQTFLNDVGYGCRPGLTTSREIACLKDYRMTSQSRDADAYCPRPYSGKSNASAAEMIYESSQACGINPKVLITLLQKEQSLLTASSWRLVPSKYNSATGYGCPDNSTCDPQYQGLDMQLYSAARQIQKYRIHPEKFRIKPGVVNEIKYSVDPQCGTKNVLVENFATAALYNYTPYTPSDQTLQGEFDECSQFGNANFYGIYKTWFSKSNQD